MMKKRPTLSDIAKAAGVSVMTVSRVINNKPGVSDEVRRNILKLTGEMGYHPNYLARSLATRRTATVGLVVPDNTNPFFAQVARGVEDAVYENRYSLFLVNTNEDPVRELAALDSLWQKHIDGVILCSPRLPAEALEEQIQRFPAVVVLNREPGKPVPNLISININDQRGAQLAIEHFLARGCRQIALINGPASSISARHRLEGCRAAMRSAGLPLDPLMIETCLPDLEGGRLAAAALLSRLKKIDAIYAFNDLVAIGAVRACEEAGRKVPEDIAIIGADDIPLAAMMRPQLTTLHVNLRHIGRLAIRSLFDIIEGGATSARFQIEPELYIRESA